MALPKLFIANRVPLFTPAHPRPHVFPAPVRLRLTVQKQRRTLWCWAAVAVAVAEAYGDKAEQQCDVAARLAGTGADCCKTKAVLCNAAADLGHALHTHYESEDRDPIHRTAAFVKDEIDAGSPLAVRIEWANQAGGHFVVISGYVALGADFNIYVSDPRDGLRSIWSLSRFAEAYRHEGAWDITFRTQGAGSVPRE